MSTLTKLLMLLGIGLFLAAASVWFIGGKKKEYNDIRTIKAQAYQVFPYLVDPELKKKWRPDIVDMHLVSDEMEEGANLRTVVEVEGGTIEFEDRVIRYQKNELVAIKSRSDEISSTSFARLKAKGQETEIDFRRIIKLGGVTRFTSVFGEDLNPRLLEEDLSRLIKLVEEETDHTISEPVTEEPLEEQAEQSAGG